jgi:FecR protein
MINKCSVFVGGLIAAALTISTPASAQQAGWHVEKASGEVWLTTAGAQRVSLSDSVNLNPGDDIRTGKNGRVLLTRGDETILISPNSAIAIPDSAKDGMSTTVDQAAGTISLEVEKRSIQHFEVVTPYLAAVVKGTQFTVSVSPQGSRVGVSRGQVEVADFKTGQFGLVLPGQRAEVRLSGTGGLTMSGTGTLGPVQQGQPRSSDVKLLHVPAGGLSPPQHMPSGHHVRVIAARGEHSQVHGAFNHLFLRASLATGNHSGPATTRILSPLGEVKINFQKVTHGLARGGSEAGATAKNDASKGTIWGTSSGQSVGQGGGANSTAPSSSYSTTTSYGNASSYGAASVGAQIGSANAGANGHANGNAGGNGNGNAGGNGNGNAGGNGNGNAGGNGNGNAGGNGNGNAGGNGNGNAGGNGKGHG